MKRKYLTILLCILAALLLAGTFSLGWFADTLQQKTDIDSFVHKSYFESGDGSAATQYQTYDSNGEPIIGKDPVTGETLESETGCAFEIKYPVQLYYFAWLQALGYFNEPTNGQAKPFYFYLSADLDMTGWVLPQAGTQDYPFIGNFDGNGHTILNLTVQNIEGSGSDAWTDKPEDINGLNIVGFFGVVGGLGGASGENNYALPSGAPNNYTYAKATNEIKNFTLEDVTIKTDLPESLAGLAAGFVNGTMENVKVVGGTLHSTATTALSYTPNLSDYGAVGYCTAEYKDSNKVTTVRVYDPQSYTTAGGSAEGQGNNWGESVNMREMYDHLHGVYTSSNNQITVKNSVTITHHTDGTVTEELSNDGTSIAVSVDGFPVRVTEVDDGKVIASYSLIKQSVNSDFIYLYGENVASTRNQNVTHVFEKDAYYIYHDNDTSHNLSFNGTAFSDAVRNSATKWVMEDAENDTKIIYAVINNRKYYLKNDNGTLSFTSAELVVNNELNAVVPNDATKWTVTDDKIYNNDRYLCFRNGVWQLLLKDSFLITDDNEVGSKHYLTVVNGAYTNTMNEASSVSWVKTMVSDDADEDEFYLSTTIGTNTYYLKNNNGELELEANPTTPSTKWKYKEATENEKSKVYTVINEEGDGYALYYDDAEDVLNWALTDFSEQAAGSGIGDSFGDSINMKTIYNRLSSAWDQAAASTIRYVSSETIYIGKDGNEITANRVTNYSTKTAPYITSSDSIGSYSFARYNQESPTEKRFLYLYGDDTITLTKTVTTITYSDKPAYFISDEGHYLTCTENAVNNNVTVQDNATRWVFSDGVTNGTGGTVSMQINGTEYYLRNNNGTLRVGTTVDSNWKYDNGRLGNGSYFLVYDGGWKLTNITFYFLITDGSGNYLNSNNATISRGTDATNATHWHTDASGHIYNDAGYYLRNNSGTLGLYNGTNTGYRTAWTIETDQIRSGNYYLHNNNGTWALKNLTTTYIISDGNGNYLRLNGNTLQNTNDLSQATHWTFSNGDSGGYISSGNVYLRNNNGTLTTTTNNRTSWTIGGSRIYNGNYYLRFVGNTWSLTNSLSGYRLSDGNGHYLSQGNSYYVANTGQSSSTIWLLNDDGSFSNSTNVSYILSWYSTRTPIQSYDDGKASYKLDSQNRLVAESTSGNYYVRYSDGWTATTTVSDATIITAEYVNQGIDLVITSHVDNSTQTYLNRVDVDLNIGTDNTLADWQETAVTTEPSTYTTKPTYLPLSLDDDGTIHRRNTGYIISGAEYGTPGTENYGQNGKGDIRVSYYAKSNISESTTNGQMVNTSIRTINSSGDHKLSNSEIAAFHKFSDTQDAEGSFTKMNAVLSGDSNIYGLHFMNAEISENSLITVTNAKVNGKTYESFQLPRDSIDFTLKERGYINFFAGTYFGVGGSSENDSFFSLHKIERSETGNITSIKEILEIYGNGNEPYVYKLKDKNGNITYESWEYYPSGTVKSHTVYNEGLSQVTGAGYTSVFNTDWIKKQNSLTSNAVYYFEIPVDKGEYALGSVPGGYGAYLMYLDIGTAGTALKPEGNAKLEGIELNDMNALHDDAGPISYTIVGDPRSVDVKTNPTYYPLAWDNGTVSDTNTGYVISGANTDSRPPGDIRVSRYSKYAGGTWTSINHSLTSQNEAGILNDARVYTIINGTQYSIANYGIGKLHTMQYGAISEKMNNALAGQQYVYGLHFMNSSISADSTVTVPKAVINGTEYTDLPMPQDCFDFHVAQKGRIAFLAGAYFSGSTGTHSFFSLHRIIRYKEGDAEVTDGTKKANDIKFIGQLREIYSDGNKAHDYIYRYVGDNNYYNADHSQVTGTLPSGYSKIYDLGVIDHPEANGAVNAANNNAANSITPNAVYYFEIPVDSGEYALGSSDTDGAYLIYLDIAANADFSIQTTSIETTEVSEYTLNYPKGIAFTDAKDSTVFDTDGKADPEKSVFLSIPMTNSSGDTSFSMTADGDMTVTNASSSLAGYTVQTLPLDNTLTVNGVTLTSVPTKTVLTEILTEQELDLSGTSTITVTTTVQTTENGTTTTVVTQTVTTEFNGSSTTVTTSPDPAYDGHELIPTDYNVEPNAPAKTILEYRYSGNDLANTVVRNGELNIVIKEGSVTINGKQYNLCDVEKVDSTDAGTYDITISGTAGTYTVNVTKINTDFVFTINNAAVTSTGEQSVAVTASP